MDKWVFRNSCRNLLVFPDGRPQASFFATPEVFLQLVVGPNSWFLVPWLKNRKRELFNQKRRREVSKAPATVESSTPARVGLQTNHRTKEHTRTFHIYDEELAWKLSGYKWNKSDHG